MGADSDRFARLDALFQGALERPPDERAAWLDRECDDPELRSEVEELLFEDAEGGLVQLEDIVDQQWQLATEDATGEGGRDLTAGSAHTLAGDETRTLEDFQSVPSSLRAEEDPEQLGPYRILGRLGRGGIATVYLAEREGEFSMPVALKRIRRGMDTDDILERLRLERQILARLVHPNICRIHDGGSDEQGRPYLVMEVIEGKRIDQWCIDEGLPLRERLEAFEAVCEAVAYAHQNLVLHRDLKPSNILVTAEGVPKLLDFGIAKVLRGEGGGDEEDGPEGSGAPTLTRMEERLLTPEYASPEQLLGLPLNTASDVYSLGILLYELASGRLPHKPEDAGRQNPLLWAITRRQQDADPLSDAQRRSWADGNPLVPVRDRFAVQHRSELDAVVAKALEVEPAHRYTSVRELADDLRRLLDGDAVLARRQTWTYRARKLIRRHRTGVAVAAVVASSMMAAVVGTSWQASVARQERSRAEQEKLQAEAVVSFMVDLFAVSDPYSDAQLAGGDGNEAFPRGDTVTARDLLDAGARRIRSDLHEDPLARADIQRAMAQAYFNLSLFDDARALLETARDGLSGLSSQDPEVETARAAIQRSLGLLEARQGDFDQAEIHLKDAERRFLALDSAADAEIAKTLEALGELERLRGNLAEAESLLERALARHIDQHGEGSLESAGARAGLARILQLQDRHAEATQLLRVALAERTALLGKNHPLVLETNNDLTVSSAGASNPSGEDGDSQLSFRELLEKQRKVLGNDHADLVPTLYNLAETARRQKRTEEAEAYVAQAWALAAKHIPNSHLASKVLMLQGLLHSYAKRFGPAEEAYRHALAIRRRLYPPIHPETANTLLQLGGMLAEIGDPEAEPLLFEALEINVALGLDSRPSIYMALADSAVADGRWAEAESNLRLARQLLDQQQTGTSHLNALVERRLAEVFHRTGRPNEAIAAAEKAVAMFSEHVGETHRWTAEAVQLLERVKG